MDIIRGFRGWHERGYIPHRDEPRLTQFVTFRLADSFPAVLRSKWSALLQIENDSERRRELECFLDLGAGGCSLRRHDLAATVEETLYAFAGSRYELKAWVIMPNHVHVLFKPATAPMSAIIASWKKFSARLANQRLGLRGKFWAEDYWDTYMRDSQHELKALRYIENNPVKAGLVREPNHWPFGSARFREACGQLDLRPAALQRRSTPTPKIPCNESPHMHPSC